MESKAKLFGHAIHPILIVFPLGLLTTSVIFDVVYLLTNNSLWALISFWLIAAGVIGGLFAAVFGLIDYLAIPAGTRAKRIGLLHGASNVIVMVLFGVSWFIRSATPEFPPTSGLLLSVVGVLLAAIGGWLGGELVERLGVGVDPGANLDAPSSLTTTVEQAIVEQRRRESPRTT